jgi:hypothetical protein
VLRVRSGVRHGRANDPRRADSLIALTIVASTIGACCAVSSASFAADVPDLSGEYQFLGPDDTLAILEEEGKLKGYIDVYAGEQESDTVLSYQITLGSRQGDHVEFRTSKIHEKYYRFSGSVERGGGRKESDPDYLRLAGQVDIVSVDPRTGQEHAEQRQVVLKSEGKTDDDK